MNWRNDITAVVVPLVLAFVFCHSPLDAQSASDDTTPRTPVIDSLQLAPDIAGQLQHAVNEHDYVTAEKLLE